MAYGCRSNELGEENEVDGTIINRDQTNYQVDSRLDSREANKYELNAMELDKILQHFITQHKLKITSQTPLFIDFIP